MRYADRPGKSAVERFMQFYFLNAKVVGDLTGLFLAQLDEQLAEKDRRFALPRIKRRPGRLDGFALDRGRLTIPRDDWFAESPGAADRAVRARRARRAGDPPRRDARRRARRAARRRGARRSRRQRLLPRRADQQAAPRRRAAWMNEAGVFGRFVPDFGRVVAQMQFDMYHHYTVDEHSIRAIGLTAAIERGELADDHPLSTALFRQIASRRALYVAVLLHDIAKGRGGDHSVLGAEIALELCPRLGLDAGETETVAWLVRHHLLLSHTAFRRDIADPKTIDDFVRTVQSPERLRLLLILTVVDIRAVGPGTWTDWKRQLLRSLFDAAEERLRLGHKQRGRSEQVADRHAALAAERLDAGGGAGAGAAPARQLLAGRAARMAARQCAPDRHRRSAHRRPGRVGPCRARPGVGGDPAVGVRARSRRACSTASPRGCRGGASVVDARIHTTRDGMALDNLLVTDARGRAMPIGASARGWSRRWSRRSATEPPPRPRRCRCRSASRPSRGAVGADRRAGVDPHHGGRGQCARPPGLLARLAMPSTPGHLLHSAHIATYGERAVDVFYVTSAEGRKLDRTAIADLAQRLIAAVA
jgi:[protein-PII] uridylyltransferase